MQRDEAWHERRNKSLGASETPTILGHSPYKQEPIGIAWTKRGLIKAPEYVTSDTGHRLEAAGREWLADVTGATVDYVPARDDFCQFDRTPWLHANLDGRVKHEGRVCNFESKAVSGRSGNGVKWAGGGVPKEVKIQVQQQMLCAGMVDDGKGGLKPLLDTTVILVFFGDTLEWELRIEKANIEFQRWIAMMTRDWWKRFVVEGEDPPISWGETALQVMRERFFPVRDDYVIDLPEPEHLALAKSWNDAKSERLVFEKLKEGAESKIRYLMKDARVARLSDGSELRRSRGARDALSYKPAVATQPAE